MTILRRRRVWVLLIIAVLLIVSFAVYVIGFSYDAKKKAIDETEQLLFAARKYPTGPLPQYNIPSNIWVDEECWSFLQDSIVKSSGTHTTTVTYYSKESSNYGHRDVDVIQLQVDFAGRPSAIVRFYEGGIQGCSPMK